MFFSTIGDDGVTQSCSDALICTRLYSRCQFVRLDLSTAENLQRRNKWFGHFASLHKETTCSCQLLSTLGGRQPWQWLAVEKSRALLVTCAVCWAFTRVKCQIHMANIHDKSTYQICLFQGGDVAQVIHFSPCFVAGSKSWTSSSAKRTSYVSGSETEAARLIWQNDSLTKLFLGVLAAIVAPRSVINGATCLAIWRFVVYNLRSMLVTKLNKEVMVQIDTDN